jgi:hypothetical protein
MKRIIGLILVAALAGALAVASQARTNASSSGTRALHITKDCAGTYNGNPGEYCTIESSNVGAIPSQSKIFYFEAVNGGALDSDVALYAGPGNVALGHVRLTFGSPPSGVITFRGGSGDFRGFRATADVTLDQNTGLWHWDGTYRFRGHGR